jgi:hypothetical protein
MLVGTICVILLFAFHNDAFAQERVIIGVHEYPPYYDANGQGELSDLYRAAFQAVGLDVDIQVYPIARGKIRLLEQKVDAFSPFCVFVGEECEKINAVLIGYAMVSWFFYNPHQERILFESLDDIKGYRVGALASAPLRKEYEQHGLNVQFVQMPIQLFKKAQAGRDQFVETTLLTGLSLVKNIMPEETQNFDYLAWKELEGGLAFLSNNPRSRHLKRQFEKGLARIKQNGEYIAVFEAYWGKGNVPDYIVTDDMKKFSTTQFSLEQFYKYQREPYGKIRPSTSPDIK